MILFIINLLIILLLILVIINLNKKENFNNYNSSSCFGKRNGVSGCRDCCSKVGDTDYRKCVSSCMIY